MNETVRLIRKKQDDDNALFLIEFFKFIGCLTTDLIIEEGIKYNQDLLEYYDINFILEDNSELSENQYICPLKDYSKIISVNKKDRKAMICKICDNLHANVGIAREIADVFEEQDLYNILYNLGNLKFIHEYYPEKEKQKKIEGIRKEAYTLTLHPMLTTYKELCTLEEKYKDGCFYLEYALLNTKHIINEIAYLYDNTFVFDISRMRAIGKQLSIQYPGTIRLDYLIGSFCKRDRRYLMESEISFLSSVKKAEKNNMPQDIKNFLYYHLGRFFEKDRADIFLADRYYRRAYDTAGVPFFRVLYKVAKEREREKKWDDVVALANDLIRLLLNGYDMDMVMPKHQLYIYKSYMILGNAFFKMEKYDLAILAYNMALKIAETELLFDEGKRKTKYKCFMQMGALSMPKKQICLKLIECYSKFGDIQAIERCQEMLQEVESWEE